MKESSFIKVLREDDQVLIFNRTNSKSIKIHTEVYDLISHCETVDDIRRVSLDYSLGDQEYFSDLIGLIEELKLLEDHRSDFLEKVNFIVTDFCNLNCSHCCYSAFYLNEDQLENSNVLIDKYVLDKIIDLNPRQIGFTGGEPMVAKNFLNISKYLKERYNGSKVLATNGTLMEDAIVQEIVDVYDAFDISIDGVNREKCDAIRGSGTFDKVLSAIKLLKKYKANRISLSITLDNETMTDEEIFKSLCDELGVEPIVRAMNRIGRAEENHIGSEKMSDFMDVDHSNISQCYDCGGGVSELTVNFKGDVFPCLLFVEDEFKMGSIFEDSTVEKMEWNKEHRWFKSFSEFIPDTREECSSCELNTFCWDCPSLARTFLKDKGLNAFKPYCDDKYMRMKKEIWDGWK